MRYKRRLIALVCAVALLVGMFPASNVSAAVKAKSLKLDQSIHVMKKGEQFTLKAQVSPKSAKKLVWWKSSNPKIAEVNWKGEVTAKKKGKATISVFAGNKQRSCKVIVGTPVKKIKASTNTVTVSTGKSTKLKMNVSPKTASIKTLNYSSKNKKIATVNKSGVIKGISEGTTQITVSSTDGSNKSTKVKVKVQPKLKANKSTPAPVNPNINLTINPTYYITIVASAAPGAPGGSATQEPGVSASHEPGSSTSKPDQVVNVTGVSLSDTEKTLNLNETLQLAASVVPDNATDKSVTWKSSDVTVASVSEDGLVTPDKEGTAEISATTSDGNYSAKCTVTVLPKAVVSNNKEITAALAKKNLKTLEVSSDTTKKLTVPKGTYRNVEMVVNLPNGELENNGVFQSITIKEISEDTYFENAVGNVINLLSKKSHVIIDEKASATVTISKDCIEVTLENNGEIKGLEINSAGKVDIVGESGKKISTKINAEVTVTTTQALDIDAKNHFDITVRPGAESTEIAVDLEINVPNIFGVGVITVKVTATGEVKTVVSENIGTDELAKTVKFTGSVRDMEGNPIEGAEIYVVGFRSDYDLKEIWSDSAAVAKLTTDADGEYHTNIATNNYYLAARKDGYLELNQTVSIPTAAGTSYTNEEIILLPSSWAGKTGGVKGTVLDSAVKDKVIPGITVHLKKGRSMMDHTVPDINETKTDDQGEYSFEDLEAGYYTLELEDKRNPVEYPIKTWVNIAIQSGVTITENAIMSKELLEGQMRFILSWGAKDTGAVADLDAHLRGPMGEWYGEDSRFHTFYSDKTYKDKEEETSSYANLDVDDMDYSGPETTTVYQSAPGVYSYYVHDYTNSSSLDSTKLSESSVKVEVYVGNNKMNTYYIPQKAGTVWHVFDYDSNTNTFKTVNTMFYETESWRVGNSVEEYKSMISSDLSYIEEYYQSLEKGTGEDIPGKVAAYRKRMNILTSKQEGEAAQLYREVDQYYWTLYDECYPNYSIDKIYSSSFNWVEGKLTLYTAKQNYRPTEYKFTDYKGETVTEVTPTDPEAWKALRVTAENGHTKIIHVYMVFDFDYVYVNQVTIGEESLTATEGNYYNSEDYSQSYRTLYVYSPQGTEFAINNLDFTFSEESVKVIPDSHKVDGEYTITIQSDDASKTWIVRKQSMPKLTTPDNQIYHTKLYGNSLYVYAENKTLSEESRLELGGKKYQLQKEKSGDPNYTYYHAYTDEMTYYIHCYPVDYAYGLTDIEFSQNVTTSLNLEDSSITVTAKGADVTANDLTLSWGNTPCNANVTYESVAGKDYIGKVTVSMDGSDYSKVYKVYFESYQES